MSPQINLWRYIKMEKLRQANKTYYFETMKERYDVKENEYQASLRKELTKAAQR